MKTFELTLKLRNNLIKRRRTQSGLSPREASERAGVGYGVWLSYEALTKAPLNRWHEWVPSACKIATFFGCSPEELWPDAVLAVKSPTATREIEARDALLLASAEATMDLPASPGELFDQKELRSKSEWAMTVLTPREQKVVRLRVGLCDGGDHTFEEIGDALGVSRGRALQIFNKSIRKLRHPSRSSVLRRFLQK